MKQGRHCDGCDVVRQVHRKIQGKTVKIVVSENLFVLPTHRFVNYSRKNLKFTNIRPCLWLIYTVGFRLGFRLQTKWLHFTMQKFSSYTESDSDSNPNCHLQERDQNPSPYPSPSGFPRDLENLEKWEYTWETWKYHRILKNLIYIMEKCHETWKNLVFTKNSPLTPLKQYKIH